MDNKTFPKIGCLDLSKLTPSFDVFGIIPATKSDAKIKYDAIRDDALTTAKDAAYITIGFGVLAFQKLQVRRREYFGANK